MVVDDQALHRGLMVDLLTPLGFKVIEAGDAYACLKRIENTQPDIFLLDVSMPRMSGLELAEELRQQGIKTPIIMLSADAQERHRQPIDHSPHDFYMVKPIKNHDLLEHLGQLLKRDWPFEDLLLMSAEDIIAQAGEGSASDTPDFIAIREHPLSRELLASAEIGYKKGVQSSLDTLAQRGLISQGALAQLQQWVDSMRLDKIISLLSPVKTETTPSVSVSKSSDPTP